MAAKRGSRVVRGSTAARGSTVAKGSTRATATSARVPAGHPHSFPVGAHVQRRLDGQVVHRGVVTEHGSGADDRGRVRPVVYVRDHHSTGRGSPYFQGEGLEHDRGPAPRAPRQAPARVASAYDGARDAAQSASTAANLAPMSHSAQQHQDLQRTAAEAHRVAAEHASREGRHDDAERHQEDHAYHASSVATWQRSVDAEAAHARRTAPVQGHDHPATHMPTASTHNEDGTPRIAEHQQEQTGPKGGHFVVSESGNKRYTSGQ